MDSMQVRSEFLRVALLFLISKGAWMRNEKHLDIYLQKSRGIRNVTFVILENERSLISFQQNMMGPNDIQSGFYIGIGKGYGRLLKRFLVTNDML